MKLGVLSFVVAVGFPAVSFAQTMPSAALDFLDSNDDVQVSREEVADQMDLFFEPMDANGNGRLEFGEVEGFLPRGVFDDADENANGSISKSEYRKQVLEDFDSADTDGNGVLN